MAVKLVPLTWVSTRAYSVGDIVQHNGIRFECVTAVAASSTGNLNPIDNTSWKFDGVLRITDYYSLQYAIEFEANTSNSRVVNSIPVYIQNVERKLSKLLRSPAQKEPRTFNLRDGRDNESLFDIPEDMLDIFHLRFVGDDSGYNLESQGTITIQRADWSSFERLRQQYISNGYYTDNVYEFDYPAYTLTNEEFRITPRPNSDITEVELTYYQQVPELGSTIDLVDDDYNPINSNDQTLAEWIAAGNDADDFVQATEVVTSNLWTATTPHLLKAGSLMEIYAYLKDAEGYQMASEEFDKLLVATQIEFRKADAAGDHISSMSSAYAIE